MIDQCTNSSSMPGNLSGAREAVGKLVCQNASSSLFQESLRAYRQLREPSTFPGSGGARWPFLASLASLALVWFGWIFVCLGRAGSAPGSLSSWDHPPARRSCRAQLYELSRRLPQLPGIACPYAVVAAHSYTLRPGSPAVPAPKRVARSYDVRLPQGLPGAPAAAAEAAQKAGTTTATPEAALRLRPRRGALQRVEPRKAPRRHAARRLRGPERGE